MIFVLPDGPTARGAAIPWIFSLYCRDGRLFSSRWSG
jgi:hypothetical protein